MGDVRPYGRSFFAVCFFWHKVGSSVTASFLLFALWTLRLRLLRSHFSFGLCFEFHFEFDFDFDLVH